MFTNTSSSITVESVKGLLKEKEFEGMFEGLRIANTEPVTLRLKRDAQPVVKKGRYLSLEEAKIMKKITDDMMEKSLIQRSNSPWCSPAFLVGKPGVGNSVHSSHRKVVDYVMVNKQLEDCNHPIPLLHVIVQKFAGMQYFADIDLRTSFWQKPLSEESREITAFVTPDGLFEYLVLPMGIKTSPGELQMMVERVIENIENAHGYFDNIIVASPSLDQHYFDVLETLRALNKANMTINLEKSSVGELEIKTLGHVISGEGVKPDPKKVKSIKEYPVPTSRTQILFMLGQLGEKIHTKFGCSCCGTLEYGKF